MGNCALKPKVLSESGAPAPEEQKDSLFEDQKIDAAKSLSNLFLNDKAEKKTKEDDKITPEKMPVTVDLKTALAEAKSPETEVQSPVTETKPPETEVEFPVTESKPPVTEAKPPETEVEFPVTEAKALVTEAKSPVTETKALVTEAKAPVDDQKDRSEEAVHAEKVIDDVTVKKTETEAKPEEFGREAEK